MACLRKSLVKGFDGTLQCDEEGCEFRLDKVAGCYVSDVYVPPVDCRQDLELRAKLNVAIELRAKLIDKIEVKLEDYIRHNFSDWIHELAVEITDDLLKDRKENT